MNRRGYMLLLLGMQAAAPASVDVPTFLGLLEHGQERRSTDEVREYRRVRVAFRRTPAGWEAMPQMPRGQAELATAASAFPRAVTWTVAFDGRHLGEIASKSPDRINTYADVGLQGLEPLTRSPIVGTMTPRFSGWAAEPTYRPLVVVSKPHFRDPARWKPSAVAFAVGSELARAFRSSVATDGYCVSPEQDPPDLKKGFRESDIVVFRRYRATTGDMLISLGLSQRVARCEISPRDERSEGHWFAVTRRGILPLGSNLAMIDAGDYDGDGVAEVVLWYSGYNRDGYVLLWDHLARCERFLWNYH